MFTGVSARSGPVLHYFTVVVWAVIKTAGYVVLRVLIVRQSEIQNYIVTYFIYSYCYKLLLIKVIVIKDAKEKQECKAQIGAKVHRHSHFKD